MVITIKNKLEIKAGQKVQIPGCEPISSLTSLELAREISCPCGSLIDVKDVLRLVPGSKVVRVFDLAGVIGTGYFIELPNGPPPDGNDCPNGCFPDWYKIMKGACAPPVPESPDCAGFNFSGCEIEFDPSLHPRDPNKRPNSKPLDPLLF